MTRVAILDYGAGNLHSIAKALSPLGEVRIDTAVKAAITADLLVLPGVGAFAQAASGIASARTVLRAALEDGLPCVGICLGMQMLFDDSEEGAGEGIGLIPGRVRRMNAQRLPQIGWNSVEWDSSTVSATSPPPAEPKLTSAYFANAFVAQPDDDACVLAWTTHEADSFPSVVRQVNTVGIQFHPEKSSRAGVEFLQRVARGLVQCR